MTWFYATKIFLAFGLDPPHPLEIGYYRGGLRAIWFLARALYNFIYNYSSDNDFCRLCPSSTMTHTSPVEDPTTPHTPPCLQGGPPLLGLTSGCATQCSLTIRRVAGLELPPGAIPDKRKTCSQFVPVIKAKQVESKVWLLHLGSPGVCQLDLFPGRVTGIPSEFRYHPFHYIDHKEQELVKKRPAQCSTVCTTECKHQFYMNFGFMHSLMLDYAQPNKSTDWVVGSYNGYTLYLLVID